MKIKVNRGHRDGLTTLDDLEQTTSGLVRRHLTVGLWSLLVFLVLGFGLELFHGFKLGFYLDAGDQETRRLMWTLAHAHGSLLAILNLVFAFVITVHAGFPPNSRRLASRCLLSGSWLLPTGFFLGGVYIHGGDPGVGIFLVPAGALCLMVGILVTAVGLRR